VIEFTRQLVSKHKLDRATFDRAIAAFGPRGVVDLQAVIGHYMLCNITNATFDMQPRR
jgi:alkylhydroperoxidase family enzyme